MSTRFESESFNPLSVFFEGEQGEGWNEESGSALDILSSSELKAVRITSTFETGRAGGFGGLTGNFDGQGLSFGLLNFTIKAGSLIPLLQEFINKHPSRYASAFEKDAGRFKEMVFATKPDPQNPRRRIRDVEAQMAFVNNQMNAVPGKARGNRIIEPWKTYFGRLENDPEFQKIQVKAVRGALDRARYWCNYFEFKTERGFAFMFDLVSSHGGAWLNASKFKGKRRALLQKMLAAKKTQVGRDALTELEKMEVIANMIADISLAEWREKVRIRKLWFVRGSGKVHGTLYDIKKNFGVTDNAPDFGASRSELEFSDYELEGWEGTTRLPPAAEVWESEVNRSSSEYIRWVQQALNRILGLQLAVDGIAGVKTRSAIRSFQTKRGLVADGIVGSKTEAALVAAGAGPAPGGSATSVTSTVCPSPTFVDCPVPITAPTEVFDNFAHNVATLNRPLHTPRINNVARKILASQSSSQPIRSILIAGHTDSSGSDNFNFDLARRRAEAVARELCNAVGPSLARQLKFSLTSCGERQLKARPELSRRVELFLPKIAPPSPSPPPSPPSPPRVPLDLELLIRLVRDILRGITPLLGLTGVKLPTTARFLTPPEQAEAKTVFGASLDFSKILIADGTGFQGRKFTVAVPVAGSFHVVMLLGDLNPWHTSGRSSTLIHELAHAWQSQHAKEATAFMKNSVSCQALALADVPIAKSSAAAAAAAKAVARGVLPWEIPGISRAAAAAEDVSAYAYIPGKPFGNYAAEQIAQQVEDTHARTGSPTPGILTAIASVGAGTRDLKNEASLGVISFHRKSTPGVIFH